MLVICAGMLRSGSTVQRQIVSALVKHHACGETVQPVNKQQLLDNYQAWAESERWYVYKIHEYVALPLAPLERVKVVSTTRDWYDVTVSLQHFLGKTFEETLHSHEYTSNLPNFLSWLSAYPDMGLCSYYDLWYNLPHCVSGLANYLGLPVDWSIAQDIAKQVSIGSNLQRIAAQKPINDPEFMATRQIWNGIPSVNTRELTEDQFRQLQPLAIWWARFKDKLQYV